MKSGNKNATNEYRYFLESNFVLVYANQDANAKRFNAWKNILPKGKIKNYKNQKTYQTMSLIWNDTNKLGN